MNNQPNVIRNTDDEARSLAQKLIRTARYGSLAVNGSNGFPFVSRVAVATNAQGMPIILISQLSIHTKAIEHDNRISLMLGEPGKGDPLAHPRVSLQCEAQLTDHKTPLCENIRERFFKQTPESKTLCGLC